MTEDKLKILSVLLEQIQDNAEVALPRIERPSLAGVEVELIVEKAKESLRIVNELKEQRELDYLIHNEEHMPSAITSL